MQIWRGKHFIRYQDQREEFFTWHARNVNRLENHRFFVYFTWLATHLTMFNLLIKGSQWHSRFKTPNEVIQGKQHKIYWKTLTFYCHHCLTSRNNLMNFPSLLCYGVHWYVTENVFLQKNFLTSSSFICAMNSFSQLNIFLERFKPITRFEPQAPSQITENQTNFHLIFHFCQSSFHQKKCKQFPCYINFSTLHTSDLIYARLPRTKEWLMNVENCMIFKIFLLTSYKSNFLPEGCCVFDE